MGSLMLAAGLLLLAVPHLDGPHSRLFANEASAVARLRTVVQLQDEYMASHAYSGFACELPLLKPIAEQKFPDSLFEFLTTGTQAGYKYSLVACDSDANRASVRYQLTAVPIEQGRTGIRAFCADQTGVIWYDMGGSPSSCLAYRHALE
jgi:hypothetical protein